MWCARHDSNVRPSESEIDKTRLHSLAQLHKIKQYLTFSAHYFAQSGANPGE